jgi:hypothetical protein
VASHVHRVPIGFVLFDNEGEEAMQRPVVAVVRRGRPSLVEHVAQKRVNLRPLQPPGRWRVIMVGEPLAELVDGLSVGLNVRGLLWKHVDNAGRMPLTLCNPPKGS